LADLLVPLLQRAHNGAKLRVDMLNAKAEKDVLLLDAVGLHPTPE
jgi:hypothetical protein